jgi:hypothetical protein
LRLLRLRPITSSDSRVVLFILACVWFVLFGANALVFAQGSIRVESNQVRVPAVVIDQREYDKVIKDAGKGKPFTEDSPQLKKMSVRNLRAQDFHLYEDNQEQMIQSVVYEASDFSMVQDNAGRHGESIGIGGGRWTYPDTPEAQQQVTLPWPQYVLGYVPPPAPAGSCHKIQVKVGLPHAVVWSRGEYCNTLHPASDPLAGTPFGTQMEKQLASGSRGTIPLELQAFGSFNDAGAVRANVMLEFPWQSLNYEFTDATLYASIGVLGVIYQKDGGVVARFSDFACCDYGGSRKPSSSAHKSEARSGVIRSMLPDRFETVLDLPAGEYVIRVVLSDGEGFGSAEEHLTLGALNEKELTVSEIALCRRVRKIPAATPDAPAQRLGNHVPLVSDGFEFIPGVSQEFDFGEPLYAYFEIYDPQLAAPSPAKIEVRLRVMDAKSGELIAELPTVDATPYIKPGSHVIAIGRRINLTGFISGSFRLEVQAKDANGTSSEWRAVNFIVAPAKLAAAHAPTAPGFTARNE